MAQSPPRVHVYAEAASPVYYQPHAEMARAGQIAAFGLHSLRVVKPLAKNLALSLGLVRDRSPEPVGLAGYLDRLTAFRHLRHADCVVIALEPYDYRVVWFEPIKELLLRRDVRVVYYTSWHCWDPGWQPRPPRPWVLPLWRRFLRDLPAVCVTRDSAEALRPLVRETTVIPHPVDHRRFCLPSPGNARPPGPFRWVSVARLVEGKGLRQLIELVRGRGDDEVWLTIVGDGPLRGELLERAQGAPVTMVPFGAQKLPELLWGQDAFVLNSHRHARWEELFGMVLIEAMACGLPVVSSDCVGPRNIIAAGDTGLLVPQRDPMALGEAMLRVERDADLRRRLSAAGRQLVEERYALPIVAEQWREVLCGEAP